MMTEDGDVDEEDLEGPSVSMEDFSEADGGTEADGVSEAEDGETADEKSEAEDEATEADDLSEYISAIGEDSKKVRAQKSLHVFVSKFCITSSITRYCSIC